jgi:hypothetical protein
MYGALLSALAAACVTVSISALNLFSLYHCNKNSRTDVQRRDSSGDLVVLVQEMRYVPKIAPKN